MKREITAGCICIIVGSSVPKDVLGLFVTAERRYKGLGRPHDVPWTAVHCEGWIVSGPGLPFPPSGSRKWVFAESNLLPVYDGDKSVEDTREMELTNG